jgi:hypothetical protein
MSDNIEELKTQLAQVKERAEKFERLYTESTIKRELTKAAEKGGAFNPDQLLPYLPAKLVEVNGQQVVRVVTKDGEGNEVHHTPAQAVARLRQIEKMGNFFKDLLAGQSTLAPPSASDKIDLRKITPQQYLEIRKTHPELLGLKPKRQ